MCVCVVAGDNLSSVDTRLSQLSAYKSTRRRYAETYACKCMCDDVEHLVMCCGGAAAAV